MPDDKRYLREAALHTLHPAIVSAGLLGSAIGLWRGTFLPLLAFAILESFWLFVLPRLPAYRRRCDRRFALEEARARAMELERFAASLSPSARGVHDGLVRLRSRILDLFKTLPDAQALETEWSPKLNALVEVSLRILVAVDASRAGDPDGKAIEQEIRELEASHRGELADAAAVVAAQSRLEILRVRLTELVRDLERRRAAVTRLRAIEDLMKDLLSKPIAGRDSEAFAERVAALAAELDAPDDPVGSPAPKADPRPPSTLN